MPQIMAYLNSQQLPHHHQRALVVQKEPADRFTPSSSNRNPIYVPLLEAGKALVSSYTELKALGQFLFD